jgi:hypothetical protein
MTEKQNRNKVLLVIIGILLVSNIAMIFLFLSQRDGGRPQRPDRKAYIASFLEKEIGFSKEQLKQYDTLSDNHKERMKNTFDNMRNRKEEQFKTLAAGGFSDSVISQVAKQSAGGQEAMEVQMFTHLRSIRNLCTDAQRPKFDSLFYKVFNRRNPDGKKEEKK